MAGRGYQARQVGMDWVTPEMRAEVIRADDYACVAPRVDTSADTCRNRWGEYVDNAALSTWTTVRLLDALTLDHVKDQPKVGERVVKRGANRKRRYRAPSDTTHLVTLCHHHHLDGWATSHRPLLRAYIAEREQRRAQHG